MTENRENLYPEQILQRIIRHIPIIIRNFQQGVSINLLAQQQQCSTDVIEQIIRLGFICTFDITPAPLDDLDQS
ncbi:MAG: hypothetical protein HWQ38_18960 [Nostoc sp. NMS7]|nr:hypothetical protein [Nostoc sp. NMS7]